MAALTALGCLTWWLVKGGTRGAEIAGDLAAAAGVIAAATAIWPFLRPGVSVGSPERTIPKGQVSSLVPSLTSAQAPGRLRRYVPGSGSGPVRRSGQVVLWGPRASGKTCYLAALNTAIAEAVPPWALGGHDLAGTDFLTYLTSSMVGRRTLPTMTHSIGDIHVVMTSEIQVNSRSRSHRGPTSREIQVDISVLDTPGEAFATGDMRLDERPAGHHSEEVLAALTVSDGILLFFDASADGSRYGQSYGVAYQNFLNSVAHLEHRMRLTGDLERSRLPHRVAVCISKYDEPGLFEVAKAGGFLTARPDDPRMFPRVNDDRAEEFFEALCARSSDGSADLYSHAIRRHFHPDRVRYFAVSSIGFRLSASGQFDPADPCNLDYGDGHDLPAIRGDIHPINVLEPLLWAARQR